MKREKKKRIITAIVVTILIITMVVPLAIPAFAVTAFKPGPLTELSPTNGDKFDLKDITWKDEKDTSTGEDYTKVDGTANVTLDLSKDNLLLWGPLYGATNSSSYYFGMFLLNGKLYVASVDEVVEKKSGALHEGPYKVNAAYPVEKEDAIRRLIDAVPIESIRNPSTSRTWSFGNCDTIGQGGLFAKGGSGYINFKDDYKKKAAGSGDVYIQSDVLYAKIEAMSKSLEKKVKSGNVGGSDVAILELLLKLVGGKSDQYKASSKSMNHFVLTTEADPNAAAILTVGKDNTTSTSQSSSGSSQVPELMFMANSFQTCDKLSSLQSLLEKAFTTKTVYKDYPILKYFVENIGGAAAKAAEEEKKKADAEAQAKLIADSAEFEDLSALEKWHQVLLGYYLDETATKRESATASGKKTYDLEKFGAYNVNSSPSTTGGAKYSLTLEERLRLRAYASLIALYEGKDVFVPLTYPALVPDINGSPASEYASANVILEDAEIAPVSGKNTDTITTDVQEVIKRNESAGAVTATSEEAIVCNMEDIVKYLALKMANVKMDLSGSNNVNPDPNATPDPNNGGANTASLTDVTGSVYIESLIPTTGTTVSDITTLSSSCIPGPMLNLQTVTGEVSDGLDGNSSMESYLQLQHVLLIANSYAELRANLEIINNKTEATEYTDYGNKAVDEFLKENSTNTGADAKKANVKGIETYIKAYTSIANALDYLGVDPKTMSFQIQKIVEYGAQLLPFVDNEDVAEYTSTLSEDEPLRAIFNIETREFSDDYNLGVELSSTFVPMKTNLYDVNSVAMIEDQNWVMRFHYPFGFYRKALYIDDDVNAATTYSITQQKGTTRPCTLGDLLQPEKDVVLYIDDNLYNIDKIAEMQGKNYTRLANTEQAGTDTSDLSLGGKIVNWWEGITDTDMETIAKSGPNQTYAANINRAVSDFKKNDDKGSEYVLTTQAINKYMKVYSEDGSETVYNEYSPIQPFAVTSAIYRHKQLYNIANKQAALQKPVFVSSPNLASMNGAKVTEWNTIYNYIMLKNLKEAAGVSYKTALDMTSTIYMDIYGNIVTESGTVVIPALSNATLHNPAQYSIYTVGFVSLYNHHQYEIPDSYNNSDKYLTDGFEVDETSHTWKLKQARIGQVYLMLSDISVADSGVLATFMKIARQNVRKKQCLDFNRNVYRITEVLRGAPIENINKEFEGLSGRADIDKTGIFAAYKLGELSDALMTSQNGNSLVSLPNLAFMEGFEYVIFFAFKIMFLVLLFLLFIKVYHDAVEGRLGFKSVLSFILSCVMFIFSAFAVPHLMDLSYYQSNKHMLQKETEYLALLNLEKESEGREIGLTSVDSYESATKLYLKVDDLTIPWYSIIDDVLFGNSVRTIKDAYEKEQQTSLMANLPGMEKKGSGLYIDIKTMFDGTRIEYDPTTEKLYTVTTQTPYASFVTPYYFFLDQLVNKVNDYNSVHSIKNYSVKVMSHGAVKTVGLVAPYFTSESFWTESQDITGLKVVYGIDTTFDEPTIVQDDEMADTLRASKWYRNNDDLDVVEELLDDVQDSAKEFVATNSDLLNKITDESYLKVLALKLAVSHNKKAGVNAANAIEIYDLDARDLIRLSIAKRSNVMIDAPKSFERFVFDNTGTFGVVTVAFLVLVYFVASLVKPFCIFFIIAAAVASIVIRRLLKKDKTSAIEGFIITLAILCGINIVYSLCLKLSMLLPNMGLTPQVACIVQMIIQIGYLALLAWFTSFVIRDWKSMGLAHYQRAYLHAGTTMFDRETRVTMSSPRVFGNFSGRQSNRNNQSYSDYNNHQSVLEQMRERDARRKENYGQKFKGNNKRSDEY